MKRAGRALRAAMARRPDEHSTSGMLQGLGLAVGLSLLTMGFLQLVVWVQARMTS